MGHAVRALVVLTVSPSETLCVVLSSDQAFSARRKLSRVRAPPGTPKVAAHLASSASNVKVEGSTAGPVASEVVEGTAEGADDEPSSDALRILLVTRDGGGACGNSDRERPAEPLVFGDDVDLSVLWLILLTSWTGSGGLE